MTLLLFGTPKKMPTSWKPAKNWENTIQKKHLLSGRVYLIVYFDPKNTMIVLNYSGKQYIGIQYSYCSIIQCDYDWNTVDFTLYIYIYIILYPS